MLKNFEAELNWFTKRLLQIRLTEVKGFSLPIPFKLSDVENCDVLEFSTEQSSKEHLEELIEEIRGYYVKNSKNSVSRDDIKLEYSGDNLSVKIFGIDSDLLRSFLIGRLKTHTSLFDTRTGNVLFYVELPTDIVLSATEQTILAKLRYIKESEEILSYEDIFEICAQHKGIEQASFRRLNSSQEKKREIARSTVSYLLGKIMKSKLLENIEKEKIIKNVRGTGYQLIM